MVLGEDSHDVVVVGAGPVGAVAAVAHARQGQRVLLLEANPKAATRLAGEWLHPTGAKVLDALGMGRAPKAGGRPGHGFVVFGDDGGSPVQLDYSPGDLALSVEHGELVAALREAACDTPGVRYIEGARVTGFQDGELFYQDRRGDHSVRPGRVVAADGRNSKLRQWVGVSGESTLLSHMAAVELREVRLPYEDYGQVFLGGPGPILMYRIAEDRVRMCLDVPLAHAAQRGPAYLWDAFHPVLPADLREAFRRSLTEGAIHWAANRFLPRARYGADNVFLVGDAVGHFHPLTAAGMTMGFLDAFEAAQASDLAAYQQRRESGSYVPELLSNALYHVFSRHDASSAAIRSSVFEVWRQHKTERDRTMRILTGAPQGPGDFSAAFSRMALSAFGATVKELTTSRKLSELPRTLAAYRQWLQWPVASLVPRPTRTRYRPHSTAFAAVPLMPQVEPPSHAPARGLGATDVEVENVQLSAAMERTGEILLGDLRALAERIGHDPDWLLIRRGTRILSAIEAAQLGPSMAARMRLGRRALAQQGVSRLLVARADDVQQVDAADLASLLVSVYEVHGGEVDAVARVQEALDILLGHQSAAGGFVRREGDETVDLAVTLLCVRALSAVARHDERLAPRALRGLQQVRTHLRRLARDDGSWAAQGPYGAVATTALALSSLVHAGASPRSALTARAAEWLLTQQARDGHFSESDARLIEPAGLISARALEALCAAHAVVPEALERASRRVAESLLAGPVAQLEARRDGEDWATACEMLDSLSAFAHYQRERPLFVPRSRPAPAGDDWDYCRQALVAVSRTFSKPIAMLPGHLEVAVTCGYLLCRIADTIEDHPAVPRASKDPLFAQFLGTLEAGDDPTPFTEAFARIEGEDAELDLARNLPRVLRVFERLPAGMVEAVTRWVAEMSRGMNLYVKRDPGADGFTALLTVGDLERYCYFVAGTVGHMLTDLFELHAGDKLNTSERAALRTHAEGFGMGLQLVNILKDVTDDRERRWSFVPRAVCERAGTNIAELVDPDQRNRAHGAVAPLFDIARARLDDAIAYALTIPAEEVGVRLFCLLPLWMAALTLKDARGNDAMFVAGEDVKISRQTVEAVIRECVEHVADDEWLRDRYRALWVGEVEASAARPA